MGAPLQGSSRATSIKRRRTEPPTGTGGLCPPTPRSGSNAAQKIITNPQVEAVTGPLSLDLNLSSSIRPIGTVWTAQCIIRGQDKHFFKGLMITPDDDDENSMEYRVECLEQIFKVFLTEYRDMVLGKVL